jgi:hypothetical protein
VSKTSKIYIFICILVASCTLYIGCQRGVDQDLISYNTHIRPILSDKCFKCHGPDEKKRISGYRLDTPEGAFALLKDQKDKYGIVKGKPELSDVFKRITSQDPDYMMPTPESNLKLTQEEINLIEKWIKQGAQYEKHWAFMPIKKSALPEVSDKDWVKNEIDYFTLAEMSKRDLKPNEEEGKERLLKRMLHDITGLPPTIAEQDAFLADNNENAYEKALDKALASKHYGEKMAVIWLDIARYADSHGYQDDGLRTMWPWRDWVIHAFNSNYNYKKFITWQLAGDLLPNANKEQILATGFNRNHKITQEGGVIDEEYRVEYVSDRTNTFSKGILALTMECAKCHDHKYDPISQKDYFSTFAFFNRVPEKGLLGDISLASLADPPFMSITKEDRAGLLNFISNLDTAKVDVMVMKDSVGLREAYVLSRGAYDQPGDMVRPSLPSSVLPFDSTKYTRDRLGLTNWLFSKQNPLTSRVFVNLIWQEYFGNGIVKTSGDFGLQGDLPSHPALLDWLAADFMENGWNIKRLVKQIAMSATYRQSNTKRKEKIAIDPENVWLASGPRRKLNAELLKDHTLAASGLLNKAIGGPSVKPYQPEGIWETATSGRGQLATYMQDKGDKLYRRGMYQFIKRTVPPPNMLILDASNRDQCEVKRSNTSTPLQSLYMLNEPLVNESARYFAQNLNQEKIGTKEKLTKAFRSIVCRKPKAEEITKLTAYYDQVFKSIDIDKAKAKLKVGEYPIADQAPQETAALMQTITLMYNLEETTIR